MAYNVRRCKAESDFSTSWKSFPVADLVGDLIYHVSPHETPNPAEFVTEVCYPVKKGS